MIMQYLNEPFFNELRTKQQLGYVVHSQSVDTRNILGVQFLIQSPTRSCEYQVNAINSFLSDMRSKVSELSDEDFNI